MFFDPLYILLAIPGLILSVMASIYVNSTFSEFSKRRAYCGLTGAEAAARMLNSAGVFDVTITRVSGHLSDHYDPTCKTLRLSDSVYGSTSISAIGVACHEAGHAIQHANSYAWLGMRSALVPVVNFSSHFAYIFVLIGAFLSFSGLIYIGCILFAASVVFSLVTLPVEWDASARAKQALLRTGMLTRDEEACAAKVLNAAFMTYVAAAVSALLTLLYYIMRARSSRR